MPYSPAMIIDANTRYGLASAPGIRFSTRSDSWSPTTRNPQVRLSSPQAIPVGANEADWKRLYELTLGADSQASSRDFASSPPRKVRKTSDMRPGDCASCMRDLLPVSSQALTWAWKDEPMSSIDGLAMKVAVRPLSAAISFTPFLYSRCRSAISRASVYRRFTSCWPSPHSDLENSTSIPAAFIPLRILPMIQSSLVDWRM